MTAGIGAGIGLGEVISDSLKKKGKSSDSKPNANITAAIPSIMTPAEAAKLLKVSEEDVIAAIDGKSLKARKIGKAYRISKESLEDYLKVNRIKCCVQFHYRKMFIVFISSVFFVYWIIYD